jgi:hypothetical protein
MNEKLKLAAEFLKNTTAFELGQFSITEVNDRLIIRTINAKHGTFNHINEVSSLSIIGVKFYVDYNIELNVCEVHIF